jgi:hypothetical protein
LLRACVRPERGTQGLHDPLGLVQAQLGVHGDGELALKQIG